MNPSLHPVIGPGLPGLLRHLLQRFRAGDDAGLRAVLSGPDTAWLNDAEVMVAALSLGGTDFAAWLVGRGREDLSEDQRHEILLDAFHALIQPAPGAEGDHEAQVATRLMERFELPGPASGLLDIVRADFLITAGPLEEVPQAAVAAMRHAQWALALRGFVRCRETLQAQAPRNVYGMAAMCLHKLGRYDEAGQWVAEGLGEQQALLTIDPVRTEAELLQRWADQPPVVSILCTTYNHERYIESAIRGFLSQDCEFPFEILIHDDASTDGTQRVIRHWQQQYPQLIRAVLQTENQFSRGVRPFELLLAQARGGYVAVCEGDDFWIDAGKLQRQVGFLQANPDFSCSAHNYYHFVETALTVRPWTQGRPDLVVSARQLMGLSRLLWLPTLVFRKTFTTLPPERALAPIGDQFLTSLLGTQGRCMYFETQLSAVRRENEFSSWSPLSLQEKERIRVKTWAALAYLHRRLGNHQAVVDLEAKIAASAQANPTPRETAST